MIQMVVLAKTSLIIERRLEELGFPWVGGAFCQHSSVHSMQKRSHSFPAQRIQY